MILSFKSKPEYVFEGNDILLATTKFGDIRFVDNMLIVPITETTVLYYDYTRLVWTLKRASGIVSDNIVASPQLDVDTADIVIYDDKLFEVLYTINIAEYYRLIRAKHCFPIINRGKLWYDRLTSLQSTELNDWYEAWLDITETHKIPVTLLWLNTKLKKLEPEEIL